MEPFSAQRQRSGRFGMAAAAWIVVGLVAAASADDGSLLQRSSQAVRIGGERIGSPIAKVTDEIGLTCFQDSLTLVLNAGCFSPPAAGDCATQTSHYFIQYITPDFTTPHRITAIAFISNDAATVFPNAGVVLIPTADNRFPTPAELGTLQLTNLKATQDLSAIIGDLSTANLTVTSGTDVVLCLRFPAGQQLTAVGVGPGIVVDEVDPDQNCDFFTIDSGSNWFRPAENDPLDWGFELVLEPVLAVEGKSWSAVKALYGGDRPVLYQNP